MTRSATSPVPRIMRPPSPDLSSGYDCAFPPFPTSRSDTPTSAKHPPREKQGSTHKHQYADADPLYAPRSPRLDAGENVAKRMNNIAPGPFDGNDRRPSTSDGRSMLSPNDSDDGYRRNFTQTSTQTGGRPLEQRISLASTASRSSTFSNGKASSLSQQKSGTFPGFMTLPPPPPPPEVVEKQTEDIDAFLNRLQRETMQSTKKGSETRSQAHPQRQESDDVTSRTTEPPSSSYNARKDNSFPPLSAGHGRSRSGLRSDLAPLVAPTPNYEKELPPNPIHTPSDSGLSDDSVSSAGFRSLTSSRSSPPASVHSRNASKIGRTDYLTEDPIPRYASPESFTNSRYRPTSSKGRESFSSGRSRTPEPSLKPPVAPMQPLQSPLDPAIQRGLLHQQREAEKEDLTRNDPVLQLGRTPPSRLVDREILQPPRRPTTPALAPTPPLPPPKSPSPAQTAQRVPSGQSLPSTHYLPYVPPVPQVQRVPSSQPVLSFEPTRSVEPTRPIQPVPFTQPTQPTSKGKCRGCTEPIHGKSVKDASGRLTGRYHKQCFTCRTCQSPFPSADFYVFDNFPYCEQHYHRLNGSLCRACVRGIEGQYLETDQHLKFHPRCFSCMTCRIVLKDDYFEVGNRPYCERHAQAAMRSVAGLGPGDNRARNVQKRRTRLMMM
jgi:hypothetical protein